MYSNSPFTPTPVPHYIFPSSVSKNFYSSHPSCEPAIDRIHVLGDGRYRSSRALFGVPFGRVVLGRAS